MKEILSSVILVANNDIESLMEESLTKMAFYNRTHRDGTFMRTTLESWLGIWNLCQKIMEFRISYRNLVGVRPLALCQMFLAVF